MNTFLKTIPILIIFIFLYSCQQKESFFAKIIKENEGKDIKLRNSNDTTIQYIYLETNPDALIGAYNKILMNDSILCIVDKEKTNSIYIYNHNGKFKSKIQSIGRGAGEYVFLEDANLKQDTILIFDRSLQKMLYYNSNGEFVKEKTFNSYHSIPFTITEENYLAFYMAAPSHSKENSEVIVTDLEGEILTQFIPRPTLKKEQGRFHIPFYFATNQKGTFFIPAFEDKIYRLKANQIEPIFDFEFKNQMYSFSQISKAPLSRHTNKYLYFNDFHMADNGIFICNNSINKQFVAICGNIYSQTLHTWQGDVKVIGTYKDYFITYTLPAWGPHLFPNSNISDNAAIMLINSNILTMK
ncbi:MAG: 6-bladed beta-propeller [Odoribacter splanchnicus]